VNLDATYSTTDAYSIALKTQMIGNITQNFGTINADLQTAVTAFYKTKIDSQNMTLTTQFPELNFNYDLHWTDAPVYSPAGVIYQLAGNATQKMAEQVAQKALAKKSRGFLSILEEKVSAIPNFNPTDGGKQISLSTQSLVFDLANTISKSDKLTFSITDMNKASNQFNVNADYLTKIYPGLSAAYPRDAQIRVNALVSNATYSEFPLAGTFNMTVGVTDVLSTPLLGWTSIVKFNTTRTSPLFNIEVSSLVQDRLIITNAPYGFVDATTLGKWIDDSFSNYKAGWSLFKTGLDFSSVVGTINVTRADGDTILIAGN